MRGFLRCGLVALCALAVAAPAQAGSFGDSAVGCEGRTASQPFLRWLDPMRYVLAPNGNLESGATGWTLTGGAKVEAGNESFFVGNKSDTRSLYLPSGSTATTRPMCVQLLHPTVRYFAKNRGTIVLSTLLVEALIENPLTGRSSCSRPACTPAARTGIRRSRASSWPTCSRSWTGTASSPLPSASGPSGSERNGRSTTSTSIRSGTARSAWRNDARRRGAMVVPRQGRRERS